MWKNNKDLIYDTPCIIYIEWLKKMSILSPPSVIGKSKMERGLAGLIQKFAKCVQFLGSMIDVKPVQACFDVYLRVLDLKQLSFYSIDQVIKDLDLHVP